ncbi:hypothetical protein ACA910_015103 [Epithemia clementina (nom. ined.)]
MRKSLSQELDDYLEVSQAMDENSRLFSWGGTTLNNKNPSPKIPRLKTVAINRTRGDGDGDVNNDRKVEENDDRPPMDWSEHWLMSRQDSKNQRRRQEQQNQRHQTPRIYYVHVGKTGGTSLEQSILKFPTPKHRYAVPCLRQSIIPDRPSLQETPLHGATSSTTANTTNRILPFNEDKVWVPCLQKAVLQMVAANKQKQARKNSSNITIDIEDMTNVTVTEDQRGEFDSSTELLGRHVYWHLHTHWFNKEVHDFVLNQVINTFLFTVRSPLSRIVSAFNFHRHQIVQRVAKQNQLLQQHIQQQSQQQEQKHHQQQATNRSMRRGRRRRLLNQQQPEQEKEQEWDVDVQFLLHCFRNMDHVAQALLRDHQQQKQDENAFHSLNKNMTKKQQRQSLQESVCVALARTILSGHGPDGHYALQHFFHNYQYYTQASIGQRPDAVVLVVRMTHLWRDINEIENALVLLRQDDDKSNNSNNNHQTKDTFTHHAASAQQPQERQRQQQEQLHETHGSEDYAVRSGITTVQGRRVICCQIFEELQAYERLIRSAVNLNTTEQCQAIQEMLDDCNIMVAASSQNDNNNGNDEVQENSLSGDRRQFTTLLHTASKKHLLNSEPCQSLRRNRPLPWSLWYNQTCSF